MKGGNYSFSDNLDADYDQAEPEVTVFYDYEAEEPMVWRTADGDGYPGSPAQVAVVSVHLNGHDLMPRLPEWQLANFAEAAWDDVTSRQEGEYAAMEDAYESKMDAQREDT